MGDAALAGCLRDAGVKRVVIVDDAFDDPTLQSLDGEALDLFWAKLSDGEQLEAWHRQNPGVQTVQDIDTTVIASLWASRRSGSEFWRVAEQSLFVEHLDNLAAPEAIRDELKSLGLDVSCFGHQPPQMTNSTAPDMLLIDLFLDRESSLSGDVENVESARIAKLTQEIRNANGDRPFVVLMSSHAELAAKTSKFREVSGILAGLFESASKTELRSPEKLRTKLATWAIGASGRHVAQRFVDACADGATSAAGEFRKWLSAIGLEDYAYLQGLKLREDGQPLGEYLLGLFSAWLQSAAFTGREPVRVATRDLDRTEFSRYWPSSGQPSASIVQAYSMTVGEVAVDELGGHPLDKRLPADQLLYLALGDVLRVGESADVFLVANAACDIQFAPGTSRDNPDRPVFLVPGVIEELEVRALDDREIETTFVLVGGQPKRIRWKCKNAEYHSLGSMRAVTTKRGLQRIARLRHDVAIRIQQMLLSGLGRVGVSVAPPRYKRAVAKLYVQSEKGSYVQRGSAIEHGVRVLHVLSDNEAVDHYSLTPEMAGMVMNEVDGAIAAQQTLLGGAKNEAHKQAINEKILALGALDGNVLSQVLGRVVQLTNELLVLLPAALAISRGDVKGPPIIVHVEVAVEPPAAKVTAAKVAPAPEDEAKERLA